MTTQNSKFAISLSILLGKMANLLYWVDIFLLFSVSGAHLLARMPKYAGGGVSTKNISSTTTKLVQQMLKFIAALTLKSECRPYDLYVMIELILIANFFLVWLDENGSDWAGVSKIWSKQGWLPKQRWVWSGMLLTFKKLLSVTQFIPSSFMNIVDFHTAMSVRNGSHT